MVQSILMLESYEVERPEKKQTEFGFKVIRESELMDFSVQRYNPKECEKFIFTKLSIDDCERLSAMFNEAAMRLRKENERKEHEERAKRILED